MIKSHLFGVVTFLCSSLVNCSYIIPFACCLSQPLDYESAMFHTLLIKVENEDPLVPDVVYGPSSTATVYITVMDVNEGPVFFPDPLVVIRRENIPVGSFVAMLNATDPDYLQTQSIRLVQYAYDYASQSLFLQVYTLIIYKVVAMTAQTNQSLG